MIISFQELKVHIEKESCQIHYHLLFLANLITLREHSTERRILHNTLQPSIICLIMILACAHTLLHLIRFADVKVSCGEAPNVLVSPIASHNLHNSMECYHELLLSTIMSHIKLLTKGNVIFITPEIVKKRKISEVIVKSEDDDSRQKRNKYFGYQRYAGQIYAYEVPQANEFLSGKTCAGGSKSTKMAFLTRFDVLAS